MAAPHCCDVFDAGGGAAACGFEDDCCGAGWGPGEAAGCEAEADGCAAACEFEADPCAEACGVAAATRTVSPAVRVSGGLLITRSAGVRPAMTSTASPRSRPSCTFLSTTLLLASRVATCVP